MVLVDHSIYLFMNYCNVMYVWSNAGPMLGERFSTDSVEQGEANSLPAKNVERIISGCVSSLSLSAVCIAALRARELPC